ncbi:MAG: TM0106 family RecB-like putative nuclease [Acidobacteria bacterium]|nr:TM0106 family RecB-like putative nuclease [Acidobacteriota bacterium]
MRISDRGGVFSPTDLANFLACRHTLTLELDAVRGLRTKPTYSDPLADQLRKRGEEHEQRYVASLRAQGLTVEDLTPFKDPKAPMAGKVARSLDAMRRGADVIVQAALGNDTWSGYADVLVKVAGDSALGGWHYEAHDTKLARETRAGAILQLCVYSELLGEMQSRAPERFLVVTPAATHTYRVDEVAAYYRLVKAKLIDAADSASRAGASAERATYPDPVEHCSVCRWWEVCNAQRRKDDHIQFVANLGRNHKRELEAHSVTTLTTLAEWDVPAGIKPTHGSRDTLVKLQDQAALQLKQRVTKEPQFKLLPVEPHVAADGTPLPLRGLKRLPAPSPGDLYLDLEGDPFARHALSTEAGEGSREYLFGLGWVDANGNFYYEGRWAFTDVDERTAFEKVVERIAWYVEHNPGAHVYHYAPYEPSAFKRLAGRYATCAEALDTMLRAGTFVDLYAVVRESIRAGVESYSIKDMEQYYGFTREIDLRQAGRERQAIEVALESGDPGAITDDVRAAVEGYNRDDVRSTWQLQVWLEMQREKLVAGGADVPRPQRESGEAPETVGEREQRVLALRERLLALIRSPGALTPGECQGTEARDRALYLMAYLLDWHRREARGEWWEFFRLLDLDDAALMDERKAVSGLEHVEQVEVVLHKRTGRPTGSAVERFRFPVQDCDIREGNKLNLVDGKVWGEVAAIDRQSRTLDVKVGPARAGQRPVSAFVHDVVSARSIEDALYDIGMAMADGAADPLAMDLLEARTPAFRDVETLVGLLGPVDSGTPGLQDPEGGRVLAVQGPPGTGKTYSGGVMICDLVAAGKRVGVTALSHAAIANLLKAVRKESKRPERRGLAVPIRHVNKNDDSEEKEFDDESPMVVGGTAWFWTGKEAEDVDVLFVDEAGQMSLANTLACTVAADALVLLGDPQQLEQPSKGVHPDGVGQSALQHMLGAHKTMPPERGEFLGVTRRLAPSICDFTSECFYEDRLTPLPSLERQVLRGGQRFSGAGLRIVSVEHEGNRNASDEEVAEVARIVDSLLAPGSEWVDEHDTARQLTVADILIVAPYNAQVSRLQDGLSRDARVGTVDKFQGQEAPVVIYSMATSRPEDAPRGLGFLYSLNRFNVATSRARCLCILVANPRLFEPDCQSPAQMQLANALCRYREMAL